MFFLMRSVFCIGLVAFLLPGSEQAQDWKGLAQSARTTAAEHLGTICAATSASCDESSIAKLILASVIAGSSPTATSRKSISTLEPTDLVPAWRGRSSRS